MRRLYVMAVVLAAAGVAAWVAYPPARAWPGIQQISSFVGAPPATKTAAATTDKTATPGKRGGRSQSGPIPVAAATAVTAEMPVVLSAPGTVEPFATVEVKPRVDGQISEVAFTEGQEVKAGEVLFRLDDRLIRAQMRQAEANIKRDTASLIDAEAILKRREALVAKAIVSEAATETQRSAVEVLKASIAAGQAQLEGWRTQLDYLTIMAPISGRTGIVKTKIGANVRMADTSSLVVINQTRPISVTFSVPQVDLATLRRALASRSEATIRAAGETVTETTGSVVFIDNQVDKTTGTLLGKIEVANENEVLWPGQAVDVDLVVEKRPGYVAVPASAVLPSQTGMLAWVINEQGRATPRPVTLERVIGATAYLSDGLDAGEVVVTDGQLRLSSGAAVTIREPSKSDTAPAARRGSPAAKSDETNTTAPSGPAKQPGDGAAKAPRGRT
jgi:multidrug efflux system membrane fusion protein